MDNSSNAVSTFNAIEDLQLPPEIIRRGFFLVVIKDPEFPPIIKLDVSLLPDDVQHLLRTAKNDVQDARDVVVDCEEMYTYAANLRKKVRDNHRMLEAARLSITGRIDAVKEAVMEVFRGDKSLQDGAVPMLDGARLLLDRKLGDFEDEAERRREALQRIEDERIEKERVEKESQARKLQEETERQIRDLHQVAKQAEAEDDEEALSTAIHEARELADESAVEVDNLLAESTMLHSAPIALAPLPRVAGYSSKKHFEVEVHDLMAFFKGIVEGVIPIAFGVPEQKKLNKQADLMEGKLDWPGCRVVPKRSGRSR